MSNADNPDLPDLRTMLASAKIKLAIDHLKAARRQLRDAGANYAADYVARALNSAEGALRHMQGKADRELRYFGEALTTRAEK